MALETSSRSPGARLVAHYSSWLATYCRSTVSRSRGDARRISLRRALRLPRDPLSGAPRMTRSADHAGDLRRRPMASGPSGGSRRRTPRRHLRLASMATDAPAAAERRRRGGVRRPQRRGTQAAVLRRRGRPGSTPSRARQGRLGDRQEADHLELAGLHRPEAQEATVDGRRSSRSRPGSRSTTPTTSTTTPSSTPRSKNQLGACQPDQARHDRAHRLDGRPDDRAGLDPEAGPHQDAQRRREPHRRRCAPAWDPDPATTCRGRAA